jgi:CRISPR-associated exonuclease Cas4
MYAEDELIPISALQHLLFCERQCALIHVERLWMENRLTVEGRHLHERADSGTAESRRTLRTERSLAIRSLRLGLAGRADVVEFHDDGGVPRVVPVEYKRGRPKSHRADEVQLCAQALCLEEMLSATIESGALFYGTTRRRLVVAFDPELRALTERSAARVHAMIAAGETPRAVREPKCDSCSLLELCLPNAMRSGVSAAAYVQRALSRSLGASIVDEAGCDST